MWLLPVLSGLARAAGHVYYRLTVTGARVPASGPVLLVANHPNSILDPVLVMAAARRPVRFLAKAPLFDQPVFGRVLRSAGAVPVYRRIDDAGLMERNEETFRAVCEALADGTAVGIFPEGISHSAPSLAALKTGAARIALSAFPRCGEAFPVVPAGIFLRRKDVYRSEAAVLIGEPVTWDDIAPRGAQDRDAVQELTDRIGRGLRRVTVNLERWEDQPLIECAEAIWRTEMGSEDDPVRRVARMEQATDVLAGLRRQPDGRWGGLVDDVWAHCYRLERLGLTPKDLGVDTRLRTGVDWAARRLPLVIPPAFVLALAGFLLFVGPRLVAQLVTTILRVPEDRRSTTKFFAGMILYVLWVLLLAGVVGWAAHPLLGAVVAVAVPAIGLLGLWIRERWAGSWEDVRRFFVLRSRRQLIQELAARQRGLAERLKESYEGWRGSGGPAEPPD